MNRKVCLVNATSLFAGGGSVILSEFIGEISKKDILIDGVIYYLFVPDNVFIPHNSPRNTNIILIKNHDNKFYKNKIYWNLIGFKKWIKSNKLNIYKILSLQNIFPNFDNKSNTKRVLYIHQNIPFFDYKWSFFKKEERIFWFYKNVYIKIMEKSIKISDEIIVQTNWLASVISSKYNISMSKIRIETPKIRFEEVPKVVLTDKHQSEYKLIYPAKNYGYKNFLLLYKMMDYLINIRHIKNIKLYLTIDYNNRVLKKYKFNKNILDKILFLGNLERNILFEYYSKSDCLVFPSKIESFGLPLIEAREHNLKIICNNHPIFYEVLSNYDNVIYLNPDNYVQWGDKIIEFMKDKDL